MKKYILICTAIMWVIFFCSCSNEVEGMKDNPNTTAERCVGTDAYVSSVVSIVNVGTRTGGFVKEADELAKALQLVKISKSFLADNGISYTDFDNDDYRIVVFALALVEYDTMLDMSMTKTTIGGCVLQSLGLQGLANSSLSKVAKQLGKAVLKKAVPAVGWAIFAVEMAVCVTE